MLEIYTPTSWYSLFRCPKLVIADDGLIYNESDYYKAFRNAIGKIDYADGYIYGEDYCSWSRSPIGCIKQEGAVTLIYGDDYARLMAQPIFYIRDNRIYAADEFFKLFPVEAGYISGNVSGRGNSVKESSFVDKEYVFDGGGYCYDDSREEGPFAKFLGWLMKVIIIAINVLVVLGILAILAILPISTIMGEVSPVIDGKILFACVGLGAFMALFMAKDWWGSILYTFWFSMIYFSSADTYYTYQNGGRFTVGGFILSMILGVFVYGLTLALPSALAGTIVWFVKKPFVKKPEKKDEESASKNNEKQ